MPKKSATATRAKKHAKSLTAHKNRKASKKKSGKSTRAKSRAKALAARTNEASKQESARKAAEPERITASSLNDEQKSTLALAQEEKFDDTSLELSQEGEIELPSEIDETNEEEAVSEEIEIELPKELEPKDEKPSSREEDYALIDVIREGNRYQQQQAFKKLLSKYRGQIYNLILKIVHNPNEVEDLVQETFSKAFNSIANFNKEYAFSTWLYRIATNSSIDYLRKRRLKTFSIDNPIKTKDDEYTVEIPDSSDEPEKNVMQRQRDALVREAIEQLPPKYRTVIEMRHLQELSYEEIAEQLKIPLGTVKAHIFRAREMLYKMLRDKLRVY
jgi:RNA polymerase sigma factor (sigma-70 family)